MVSKVFKLAGVLKNTSDNGIFENFEEPLTYTTYATADLVPLLGNQVGDMAYVIGNNTLYVYTDDGWYSIQLIQE